MSVGKKNDDENMSIEVINRRLACENKKFFVYFDHIIDSTGSKEQNYLVVAPRIVNENLVTGVAILPILDQKIGLIRIYRPAIRDYSLEIPHGFIDEGEKVKSAALRELMEETGLAAKMSNFYSLGYITPDAGVLAARVQVFLAEACFSSGQTLAELGLRGFRFFTFMEFESMIENSEVQDTFTIAAWCKYKLLQNAKRAAKKIHD